jgi:hypothetical protein
LTHTATGTETSELSEPSDGSKDVGAVNVD